MIQDYANYRTPNSKNLYKLFIIGLLLTLAGIVLFIISLIKYPDNCDIVGHSFVCVKDGKFYHITNKEDYLKYKDLTN